MAVKASSTITLSFMIDIKSVSRYYKLQSSLSPAPTKPTTNPPPSGWALAEPSYTTGSTNTLYFVDLTVFSDDSWSYSDVSKSSSYEAAKEAYNEAKNAQNGVEEVQESKVDKTKVIESVNNSDETALISADRINVEDLFAKNITATGNINFVNENYELSSRQIEVPGEETRQLMIIASVDGMDLISGRHVFLEANDIVDITSYEKSIFLNSQQSEILFQAIDKNSIKIREYVPDAGEDQPKYTVLHTGNTELLDSYVLGRVNEFTSDYVIERGSGGGDSSISWKYRKWKSGVVELWGRRSISDRSCNTSFGGGMYRTSLIEVANFPFKVYYPNIQVSYEPSNGYGAFVWPYSAATADHPASYYLMRPTIPDANLAGYLNFYVRGSLVE